MSEEIDSLRELYLTVAGKETLTHPQEEEPSHEPIGEAETELERAVSDVIRQNELTDAVEGGECTGQSR